MALVVKTRVACSAVTHPTYIRPSIRPVVRVAASAVRDNSAGNDAYGWAGISRRCLLATPLFLKLLSDAPIASATTQGFKTFLGYSEAPDLYLGYQRTNEGSPPLYTFEYPADWDEELVTKTEKSTMGMDGRVMHPKTRKEMAYVIALGGKDYRDSVLKDAKTSLTVIAGGDPDMRQAVTDGTVTQVQKRVNGTDMFMYDIASDKRRYLSTIGKKGDTVFALVVTAPTSAFARDAADLQHIQDTFKLL